MTDDVLIPCGVASTARACDLNDGTIRRLLLAATGLTSVQRLALRSERAFRQRHGRRSQGRAERDADRRPKTKPESPGRLAEIIDAWERRQLSRHHPDRFGNQEVYRALSEAIADLRQSLLDPGTG